MREIKIDQSEAKRRLLDAAESLFAERGFEAVSVRDITHLAKANVAAVNYHFGTREALIALVVTRFLTPVNEERLTRLESLERKASGKALPLEEIIDAFVRPVAACGRKSALPGPLACHLLGRILALQGENLPEPVDLAMRLMNDRFTRALAKALPTLTADDLAWRTHFVAGALNHTLIHQESLPRLTAGTPTLDATLSRFVRFAIAGLRDGVEAAPAAPKGPQATFDFA